MQVGYAKISKSMIIWPCNQSLPHRIVYISHCAAGFLFTAVLDDQSRSTRCCVPCEIDQARSRDRPTHSWSSVNRVCMTARLDVTPKTTEQNRIVRTGKLEVEVTNNNKKKLRSRYCTIEAMTLTTGRPTQPHTLSGMGNE